MGSFFPSNVSICGILNFAGRGKCSTLVVNGDSVCYTRVSMETRVRPFTATFMWMISCWMSLNLCSHDLSSLRSSLRGWWGSCSLVWLVSPSLSASRRGSRCCSPSVTWFWVCQACRVSWGRRIFLVSCSNYFSKRWLVTRSASTSSVLARTVSNVPPGGRLSTLPVWSCILRGLALLLLVFRVDTISR